MEGKKDLSAARKKLQDYKAAKNRPSPTTTPPSSTPPVQVNETFPPKMQPQASPPFAPPPFAIPNQTSHHQDAVQQNGSPYAIPLYDQGGFQQNSSQFHYPQPLPPPPPPTTSHNHNNQGERSMPEVDMSEIKGAFDHEVNSPFPSVPPPERRRESEGGAGINFFQSTPISQSQQGQGEDTSFFQRQDPYAPLDFYYNSAATPLFFNVPQPTSGRAGEEESTTNLSTLALDGSDLETNVSSVSLHSWNTTLEETAVASNQEKDEMYSARVNGAIQSTSSAAANSEEMLRLKSVQDALELQLEEMKKDNERFQSRESELLAQLQERDRAVEELKGERDRTREEARKMVQPLQARINSLQDENQRILKNSNDVGMDLRSKLQAQTKLFEDMEQACIILSKAKTDLAAHLDQEQEKAKELETQVQQKEEDIQKLGSTISILEEKLKSEQQKDAIIHQLEDRVRHYQVQLDTFQRELRRANNKIERLTMTHAAGGENTGQEGISSSPPPVASRDVLPDVADAGHEHHHHSHEHNHGESGHDHAHHHEDHHHHDQEHEAGHDHNHAHDHEHGEACDHHHHHEHEVHGEIGEGPPSNRQQGDEVAEMKKRLHHLEWENATFRSDVDKLAEEAREKRQFEEKFNSVAEECEKLRNECQRLELLVVQLQGENDTIGDYIALYQSQRLALKESAREKDMQLQHLAKERESLLRKMEELTHLLKVLKTKSGAVEEGDNQAEKHAEHTCNHGIASTGDVEIEGKIRNLLSEISSSSLIENFHPCAVCSGRLMNV